MSVQGFKISRTYPVHQFENWIEQTTELIQTIPQFNNVLYWGAKGNGINDDTAAFNAAMAYGRAIYVPAGQYRLSDTITVGGGSALNGDLMPTTSLLFYNSTVDFVAINITGFGSQVTNLGIFNRGTNFTTSKAISVNTSFSLVENVRAETNDATPFAYFISFDLLSTIGINRVHNNILFARVDTVRFGAAVQRSIVSNNHIGVNASGNCIDTTGAGVNNLFVGNILSTTTNLGVVVNAVVAATFVSNTSAGAALTYAGAGLATSTIYDGSETQRVNTLAGYDVDGVQVVINRQTGYNVAVIGANAATAVNATTITATDPNIQALAAVVNAMKSSLITHGLIGA
jgi:hypothetical protein